MENLCCECSIIKTARCLWPSPVRLPGEQAGSRTGRPAGAEGRHTLLSPSSPGTRPTVGVLMGASVHRACGLEVHRAGALQTAVAAEFTLPRGVLAQDLLHQGLAGQDPGCRSGMPSPAPSWPFCRSFLCLQLLKETKRRAVTACGRPEASGRARWPPGSHFTEPPMRVRSGKGRLNSNPNSLRAEHPRCPSSQRPGQQDSSGSLSPWE